MDNLLKPPGGVRALAAWLFEARGADLVRFLRQRLGSEAEARDIAQETYLRFIRLGDPSEIKNPEAYLFRIASNLLWERKLEQQKLSGQAPLEDPPTVEHTPLELAVSAELSEKVRHALSGLPVLQRLVLILHLRDDCSSRDISARTGLPASTVKNYLHSALATCRRRLRDYE